MVLPFVLFNLQYNSADVAQFDEIKSCVLGSTTAVGNENSERIYRLERALPWAHCKKIDGRDMMAAASQTQHKVVDRCNTAVILVVGEHLHSKETWIKTPNERKMMLPRSMLSSL